MKRTFAFLAAVLLLSACAPGGLSSAEKTAAVNTAVAQLLANQAATTAAQAPATAAPTTAAATSAPVVSGNVQINIPPEATCLPIGTDRVVGKVLDIYGADEIGVEVNGQKLDVRYIGVDAGDSPMDANSALVLGKNVLLVSDKTAVDEYGRMPRYVITEDGVFVNVQLVKQGAAFPSSEAPDTSCDATIKNAQP